MAPSGADVDDSPVRLVALIGTFFSRRYFTTSDPVRPLHPMTHIGCFLVSSSGSARADCCSDESAVAAMVPLAPTRKERLHEAEVEDVSFVSSDDGDSSAAVVAAALS